MRVEELYLSYEPPLPLLISAELYMCNNTSRTPRPAKKASKIGAEQQQKSNLRTFQSCDEAVLAMRPRQVERGTDIEKGNSSPEHARPVHTPPQGPQTGKAPEPQLLGSTSTGYISGHL